MTIGGGRIGQLVQLTISITYPWGREISDDFETEQVNSTGGFKTKLSKLSRIKSRQYCQMNIKLIDWLQTDINNKTDSSIKISQIFTNFTGSSLHVWTERLACKIFHCIFHQCCLSLSSLGGALRLRAASEAEVRAGWGVDWLVLPSLPVACLMLTLNLLISLLAVVRSLWSCSSFSRSLKDKINQQRS